MTDSQRRPHRLARVRKRGFDLVVVSLAAVLWVPVVAVTALAVLVLSGRPVFYRSRRWVSADRIITMVKFRVMVRDASASALNAASGLFLNTPTDSPLYTPVGRVLERLGITELPQLVHVLRGQMTVVGPRPLTDQVRACLVEHHPDLDRRWANRPAGLTGLPQLVGREALTDGQRLELEEVYDRMAAEHYRVRTDLTILLTTVLVVLRIKKPLDFASAYAIVAGRETAPATPVAPRISAVDAEPLPGPAA